MTTIYAGTVPVTEVTCPSWCIVSQAEHLADLPAWEGCALHWSAETKGDGWTVRYATCTFVDGQLDPAAPPTVHVYGQLDTISPDEALNLARALHEAAIAAAWEAQA